MDKAAIYALLDSRGVRYEVTEHEAVFTMDQAAGLDLPHPEAEAKSLFVRDDKKRNYYLVTIRGDKRADLQEIRRAHDTRPLSLASADDLHAILGLRPGAVTPLGILNDDGRRVQVFLDREFERDAGLIGVHPNDNTATVWLRVTDLVALLQDHGTPVRWVHI